MQKKENSQFNKDNIKREKWSNKIGDLYDLKKMCVEKGFKLKSS